jgi:hypothetical protein
VACVEHRPITRIEIVYRRERGQCCDIDKWIIRHGEFLLQRLSMRRRIQPVRPVRAYHQLRHLCRASSERHVSDGEIYRLWVRLRENGGRRHAMPCHHNLEEYLIGYLDGAGPRSDPKRPLFRTIGRGTGKLTLTVLPRANAYA